jgi:hypothetical protein
MPDTTTVVSDFGDSPKPHTTAGDDPPFRAAFIRTRHRKLRRRRLIGLESPIESVTFDVVRCVRENGRPVQRFVIGLGTLKFGVGWDGRSAWHERLRQHFVFDALLSIEYAEFPPELERKLLVELAAKAPITVEDVERSRKSFANLAWRWDMSHAYALHDTLAAAVVAAARGQQGMTR